MKSSRILIIILTSLLYSCGPTSTSSTTPVTPTGTTDPTTTLADTLVGTWTTGCLAASPKIRSLNVFDQGLKNSSIQNRVYSDKNCTLEIYELTYSGNILVFPPTDAAASYNHLDIIYSDITITPRDQNTVKGFNAQVMCGFINWTLNLPKSVIGLSCAGFNNGNPFPATGVTHYDIYRINGNNFYLGDEFTGAGDKSTNRPSSIDVVNSWVKSNTAN